MFAKEGNNGGQITMSQKIYPTCRLCEKLNAEMTHCAIYGKLAPENIDNTALAGVCAKGGEYVRMLHAVPNEFNYGKLPKGKKIDEEADETLFIFNASDEKEGFQIQHGMSLEEWAQQVFKPSNKD